tara:strand:+ start:12280 stop:12750 length:471 start_codon:yes stop_codon:yes gene_type:complete
MKALAHNRNPFRSRRFFTALRSGLQKAIANKGLVSTHLAEVKNPDLVYQVADFLLTCRRRRRSLYKRRFRGRLNVPLRLDQTKTNAGNILCDIFDNRGNTGENRVTAGGSFEVGENASPEEWEYAEETITKRLYKRLSFPEREANCYLFKQVVSKT